MKDPQKIFIILALLVITTLSVVSGGVYIYKNNKSENFIDSVTQPANTQTLPSNTQQSTSNNKPATGTPTTNAEKPIITSISQLSGPIGTVVELRGYRLLDNRGDQNLVIENSKGEVGSLGFGNPEHLNLSEKYVSMKFALNEKICKQWETDAGGPCTKGWMIVIPGEYKIYVAKNGFTDTSAISNKITFFVTAFTNAKPSITVLSPNGGETVNWGNVFMAGDLYFKWTTSQKEGYSPSSQISAYIIDEGDNIVRDDPVVLGTQNLGEGIFVTYFIGEKKLKIDGRYKIKVCDYLDNDGFQEYCDLSDDFFTIK